MFHCKSLRTCIRDTYESNLLWTFNLVLLSRHSSSTSMLGYYHGLSPWSCLLRLVVSRTDTRTKHHPNPNSTAPPAPLQSMEQGARSKTAMLACEQLADQLFEGLGDVWARCGKPASLSIPPADLICCHGSRSEGLGSSVLLANFARSD